MLAEKKFISRQSIPSPHVHEHRSGGNLALGSGRSIVRGQTQAGASRSPEGREHGPDL